MERLRFKEKEMSNGLVTQIIGAVIDVEFEKNNIPQVYEAIKITDTGTVLERSSSSLAMELLEQLPWEQLKD